MSNKMPGCHLANAWRSRSKLILQWRYRNEVSVHSINLVIVNMVVRPYYSCAEGSAPLASIRQRIDFKIAVFVYNALHGRGPTYLSRTCNPVREVGARAHLRSAIRGDLTVPRTRTRRYGPRSFRVSGPVVWNSLPEDLRAPELSLERFKS